MANVDDGDRLGLRFYSPDGRVISAQQAATERETYTIDDVRLETTLEDADVVVSSSFLVSDANPARRDPEAVPWLWETMIVGGPLSGASVHTPSRGMAECVHMIMVGLAQATLTCTETEACRYLLELVRSLESLARGVT